MPRRASIRRRARHHDASQIGVGAHDIRHHGGVDYAQSLDSANLAVLIDDGTLIGVGAHLGGADRMIDPVLLHY